MQITTAAVLTVDRAVLARATVLMLQTLGKWAAWLALVDDRRTRQGFGPCRCGRCLPCKVTRAVRRGQTQLYRDLLADLVDACSADDQGEIRPCDCGLCLECVGRWALDCLRCAEIGQPLPEHPALTDETSRRPFLFAGPGCKLGHLDPGSSEPCQTCAQLVIQRRRRSLHRAGAR